jgi:hypothetical protein
MARICSICLALLLLSACSSSPKTASSNASQPSTQAQPKPAEYLTGRVAVQKMYISARGWAGDAKLFRLQSQLTPDAPTSEGKAGLWRASFAAPSKRAMKLFVWSGLIAPDAPEPGITFSAEDSWNPNNSSTQVFDLGFIKIDSDKAYEVAQKHGGDKWTAKDPKQPVFFVLDWNSQKNESVWHVIYGSTQEEARMRIAVDATSGEFLRVER